MKSLKVLSLEYKSSHTFSLKVERPSYIFQAGQCFNVGVPGVGINREYSMYSGEEAQFLEFLIRRVDDGLVSVALSNLKPGDLVEVDGPYGEFCIPHEADGKFIFIGSGTGIAPFHSFVMSRPSLDYRIIHAIRYDEEKYDHQDYAVGRYFPCISRSVAVDPTRVTDFLQSSDIDLEAYFYLCGNRNMIIDSVQILLDRGVSGDQIITEVFF